MPRAARPWFRFYVEAMRDPKMRRLSPTERWLWVAILAAARESYRPPYLMVAEGVPYSWPDLADYAGMKVRDVERGTDMMHDLGMVEYDKDLDAWFVPKFPGRQFESDDVSSRVQRSRQRRSNVPTLLVATPPETESDPESKPPSSSNGSGRELPPDLWMKVAEEKLKLQPPGAVKNPDGWLPHTAQDAQEKLTERAQSLLERFDVTTSQLACALASGSTASWGPYRRETA